MNFNDYLLILVIGLSRSGKTTYCKNNIKSHKLYDDFIPSFYEGKIIKDLICKRKIVLNDPRLCNFNIFTQYMNIFEKYVSKNDILLVLFENDKDKCIQNINKNKLNVKNNVENNIIYNSKSYNTNNYTNYNNIYIEVYYNKDKNDIFR